MSKKGVSRMKASIAGLTEVGPVRSCNQDAIVVASTVGIGEKARLRLETDSDRVIVAVVDGMGGYAGGDRAASVIACEIARLCCNLPEGEVRGFIEGVSQRVFRAGEAWGTPQMGAALAMMVVSEDGVLVVNVGDCRAYRLRDGYLGQLSVDDRTSPSSSALTQAMGGLAFPQPHVFRCAHDADDASRYILCSDGVWSTIGQSRFAELCSFGDAGDVVEDVSDECNLLGAADNCSIVGVDVAGGAHRG